MLVSKITTYVSDALSLLSQQYKGRARIASLLTTWVNGMQELENALYPLDAGRQIQNSVGVQLDGVGSIVGVSRNGLNDQQFLLFIYGKIVENNSDTTIATMITAITFLYQCDTVFLQEYSGGIAFQIINPTIPASLLPTAKAIVQETLGAGIELVFVAEYPSAGVFRFAGPNVSGTLNGFADPNVAGSGGVFVNLI